MARTAHYLATLLGLGALLGTLNGCGSMSDLERTEYPRAVPAPPPAAAPVDNDTEAAAPRTVDEYEDTDPAAMTDFKQTLDPHGRWVEDPTYGTVWVPSKAAVGDDFAPYVTAGHWELDENDDYLWVSDYDPTFGWVVFHYGRWVYVTDTGWAWIPGRRYAPAWVVWRTGDPGYDYVGWAPAPAYYCWCGGGVVWLHSYPYAPFVFVNTTYVFSPGVHTYIVPRDQVYAVANHTHNYGNYGSGRNQYATPHKGPTSSSGHIPNSTWSKAHHNTAPNAHATYAKPSAQGRAPTASGKPGFGSHQPKAGSAGFAGKPSSSKPHSSTGAHATSPSSAGSKPSSHSTPHATRNTPAGAVRSSTPKHSTPSASTHRAPSHSTSAPRPSSSTSRPSTPSTSRSYSPPRSSPSTHSSSPSRPSHSTPSAPSRSSGRRR